MTGNVGEVARHAPCPTTGVPACGAERQLLRLVDQFLERGRRRLDAALLQQRLVVEQAVVAVRTGTAISLPSIVIAETRPGAMSSNSSIGSWPGRRPAAGAAARRSASRGCSRGSRRRNRCVSRLASRKSRSCSGSVSNVVHAISASCASRHGLVRSPATPVVRHSSGARGARAR